jgi:hypothetical protein
MQIASRGPEFLGRRISTILNTDGSCAQCFEIPIRDLACGSPRRISFEQVANLPNMKKILNGHGLYYKGPASLPLKYLFTFQSANRLSQWRPGNVNLPRKMGFHN